ncbi:MAG TPA: hypothetical protein VJT31_37375 [Rugosimonospora sp.]|nr:hypothetical protein [Rugosimonospora sp.]
MTHNRTPSGVAWSVDDGAVVVVSGPRRGRRGAHHRSWLTPRRKVMLSILLGLGMVPALVASSLAAWTVTTSNSGNTFATNTILLQDNQGAQDGTATSSGTAMFTVTNLEPNSPTTTQCIGVVFAGTASIASLTLTAALAGAGQATLQDQLTMNVATDNTSGTVSVTGGTNTNSGSCTNYPAGGSNATIGSQGATLANWASASPYTIASPVTNTWYKFTVSGLPAGDTSCATYCGKTITIALTWTLTTT